MSLNGLDTPQVQQAYNAALTEAGGWFLLKYTSRDAVELLGSGENGVVEARNAISKYEDLSPLYGLIMYRRRKVLIKYIPEGTSRLLQARTTVHLQDFLENYSPYDTLLEVSAFDGLSDTTLAAAFPLHTAGGSPAASSPQLDEISEDAEEGSSPKQIVDIAPISSVPSRRMRAPFKSSRPPMSPPKIPSPLAQDEKAPILEPKPSLSQYLVREESGHRLVTKLSAASLADYAPTEGLGIDVSAYQNSQSGHDVSRTTSPVRQSTSSSPKTTELETMDYEKYYENLYKPKIKLGPRPITVSEKSKRSSYENTRPVSSLPPGLQPRSKPANPSHAPPTQTKLSAMPIGSSSPQISMSTLGFSHSPPPIPDDSAFYPPRPSSRGSSRSLPLSTRTATSTKTSKTAVTPEKLRLMKAMELRKKQMRKSTPPETSTFASTDAHGAVAQKTEGTEKKRLGDNPEPLSSAATNKADSGISMDYEASGGSDLDSDANSARSRPQSGATQRGPTYRDYTNLILDPLSPIPKLNNQESNDCPALGRVPEKVIHPHPQSTILRVNDSAGSSIQATPEMLQTEGFSNSLTIPNGQKTPEIMIAESEQKDPEVQKKRRGLVEPLTIDIMPSPPIPTPNTEQNYLSDEEFYEELQSATFQEAKPVIISRSPASPFFPRRPSARSAQSAQSIMTIASVASLTSIAISKAPTNPVERASSPSKHLSPDAPIELQSRAQSISSARTPDSERGDPMSAATQRKVSSGISKRIAALAEKSTREGSPPGTATSQSLSEKTSFVNMRKASIRDTSDSRPSSTGAESRPTSKLSMWPGPEPVPSRRESAGHKDTISVTARIVRPSPDQNGSSTTPGELHQSPILINHTRSAPKPDYPPMDAVITDSVAPVTSNGSIASSGPVTRPQSASYSVRSDESIATSARKSFSRYRGHESPRKSKGASTASLASDSRESRDDSEKSSSRTTRFFKRISTLGNKRKSVTQAPTSPPVTPPVTSPKADPTPTVAPATLSPLASSRSVPSLIQAMKSSKEEPVTATEDVPPPVVIGDINVQFPDNLLWKRRWSEIDSAGNIIFTAAAPRANQRGSGFVIKFHMRELGIPYVPDIDAMARPHSVVFDLTDGTGATLICSSEDAMAQRQLLSLLTTYHRAWITPA